MKKLICIGLLRYFLICLFFTACGDQQEKVIKVIENGNVAVKTQIPDIATSGNNPVDVVGRIESSPAPSFNPVNPAFIKEKHPLYKEYRVQVISAGWMPMSFSDRHDDSDCMVCDIVRKDFGWVEVEHCAGTGLSPCLFKFTNDKGEVLDVHTMGENYVVDRIFIGRLGNPLK